MIGIALRSFTLPPRHKPLLSLTCDEWNNVSPTPFLVEKGSKNQSLSQEYERGQPLPYLTENRYMFLGERD